METFSYSFARQNLKKIFDTVTEKVEEVFITRRNGKNIVILSEEEFSAWKETLYLMQNPHNALHLKKSMQEKSEKKTKTFSFEEL